MKRPIRPLTLRDVAEAAGVSEMTVSRVLRNTGDVSGRTREHVLSVSRSMGYVPNRIAGSLATQSAGLVAVLIPSLSNMVFADVLDGINEGLSGSGLQAVIGITGYSPETEESVLFDMLSWRPAGVIIAGVEHNDATRAMLTNAGIPTVEVMDTDGEPIDAMVGISHTEAGRAIAQEICAAGYQRIGYVGTTSVRDHRARKRRLAFEEVLHARGLSLLESDGYQGESTLARGRAATRALLSDHPDLDFIYYSNDLIAAGGLLELLSLQRDVPDGIGLAGFNNLAILDGMPLRVSTVDARRFETGLQAARVITSRLGLIDEDIPAITRLQSPVIAGDTLRTRA